MLYNKYVTKLNGNVMISIYILFNNVYNTDKNNKLVSIILCIYNLTHI